MRNSTVAVVMIAMLVVGVPGVSAQTLTEGARVRVTRQPDKSSDSTVSVKAGEEYKLVPKQITGTVVRLDEEEVAVIWDGRLVSVPLERVTRLEVSRGGKSRGRGAGTGFLIGAGVGGVLGAAAGGSFPSHDLALIFGVVAGVLGAVIGAAVSPGERWEEIERGQRLSLDLTLPKRGIGAQIKVGW